MQELNVKFNSISSHYNLLQQILSCDLFIQMFEFLKLEDIYSLKPAKFLYQLHHKKFKTALNDCFVDMNNQGHNTRTKYFKPRVQRQQVKNLRRTKELIYCKKI